MTKSSPAIKLADMQRNFISDCLSGKLTKDNTLMAADIDTHAISAQGLMGIYQSSAIANITHSLSLTYPVIEKLVGEDFFRATCRQFIREVWPKSANMDDYGGEFPEFLSEFKHAKHLAYLADVARLEWAFHQSSLADNSTMTDWSTLAQVTEILQLQFVLAPSHRLIKSAYPIDKIWQVNQDNALSNIEIDFRLYDETNNSTFLVLIRPELKTVIVALTEGEFEFLHCLENNQTFEQAITTATVKQEDFSVDNSLKKLIELSIIIDFKDND